MAGHSKWANIKRKKARMDEKKGKLFTKLAREISVAVKEGGADPALNPRLSAAIQKAKAANMPNENIERAIKKGSGGMDDVNYENVYYEGYGPGGAAVLCSALTDNRNRTAGEIRHIFTKRGGNLGESGCVSWMFEKKGQIIVDLKETEQDEDDVLMAAIDSGAEDVEAEDSVVEIITLPEDFKEVKDFLEEKGIKISSAEVTMVPQNTVVINDQETAEKMLQLIEDLEDLDDVQEVYSNYDIPEDLLKNLN
ncbi:MAG: YebC/PmpR family DNA-binding transcriptional regulator [Clostridia bacterium]|nr:YebC/PmpR family DNA-binding transcriptional regulator [Clostridia bacterium]